MGGLEIGRNQKVTRAKKREAAGSYCVLAGWPDQGATTTAAIVLQSWHHSYIRNAVSNHLTHLTHALGCPSLSSHFKTTQLIPHKETKCLLHREKQKHVFIF